MPLLVIFCLNAFERISGYLIVFISNILLKMLQSQGFYP
jgi:hypothetical protein